MGITRETVLDIEGNNESLALDWNFKIKSSNDYVSVGR